MPVLAESSHRNPRRLTGAFARRVHPSTFPRCVAIGGGTGLPVVLRGLLAARRLESGPITDAETNDLITAIVTVTDDGGSSGRLRRQLGILPPGDVRNCLTALAPDNSLFSDLLQHRFSGESDLAGHPIGNLLLAALAQMSGGFQTAIERMSALMQLQGCVLPSTEEDVSLHAEFHGGDTAGGETAITTSGKRIKRLSLERSVRPVPEALRALVNADVVVVGPGSLYTSIIPNLLVGGIASTIAGVRAVRIYVANLMTEPGETEGYALTDHLAAIRSHCGFDLFDYILVNRAPIRSPATANYAGRGSTPVSRSRDFHLGSQTVIVERDLVGQIGETKIRHCPVALATAILELARAGRRGSVGAQVPEQTRASA
jgi:uncharacterized cofD-like protein